MEQPDVQALREIFIRQGIMLCFNGPFSASLIEEMGRALRTHMEGWSAEQGAVADVFSVYIEIAQNIRKYAVRTALAGADEQATVVVSRTEEGRYAVSAGNVVRDEDGLALQARIQTLARMDKTELKAEYKRQMRLPMPPDAASGAGLGLIDMARKACVPLDCSLKPMNGQRSFFNLRVVI